MEGGLELEIAAGRVAQVKRHRDVGLDALALEDVAIDGDRGARQVEHGAVVEAEHAAGHEGAAGALADELRELVLLHAVGDGLLATAAAAVDQHGGGYVDMTVGPLAMPIAIDELDDGDVGVEDPEIVGGGAAPAVAQIEDERGGVFLVEVADRVFEGVLH